MILYCYSNEVSFSDPRYSVLKDGTLMIENALLEDVGVYECMAKNPAGDVKSRSAVMRVSGATGESLSH
jgi:peroxidase